MTDSGDPPACASQDMDADIDRILSLSGSLGSLDLGLDEGLNMCLDDQQRRDQSISPQSVIGTATAAAAKKNTSNRKAISAIEPALISGMALLFLAIALLI